jgi:tetratricopeptide (TPR) repeat protein
MNDVNYRINTQNIMHAWKVIYALCFLITFTSCRWQEAKEVIAVADSMDLAEHVIYDDTAALGRTIRSLDNPIGRVLMSNTLGKAYYYMGRNYSLSNQIAEAAECYIYADRLQIDDPIYRGRVNSCMGYICAQNKSDSLALIFYEHSNKAFLESHNDWYYAQSLLNMSYHHILLHQFVKADSLLQIAYSYLLDSAYQARYYETKGLYFYEQQQYDSALVYFNRGLNYWQSEEEKCFSYLKIMQTFLEVGDLTKALPYSQLIIKTSNHPNHLTNAYYCLMQDAKRKNNTELLSQYSHARTDAQRLLREVVLQDAEALSKLENYLANSHPLRWIWLTLTGFILLSLFLFIAIIMYRKYTTKHLNSTTSRLLETTILLHKANEKIDNLSTRIKEKEVVEGETKVSYYFNKNVNSIRSEFPAPSNKWNDYKRLKKDIDPWLHNWLRALDQLNLADREKILCVYTLLYPHLSTAKLADYMNYDTAGIRVFKTRMVQKLGIKSSQLPSFLRKLSTKG